MLDEFSTTCIGAEGSVPINHSLVVAAAVCAVAGIECVRLDAEVLPHRAVGVDDELAGGALVEVGVALQKGDGDAMASMTTSGKVQYE